MAIECQSDFNKNLLDFFIDELKKLSNDDRIEFLKKLKQAFCFDCGSEDCSCKKIGKIINEVMGTYLEVYYYETDRECVIEQLENGGATIQAIITMPHWNVRGQIINQQFAVIYQAKKEIGAWVKT